MTEPCLGARQKRALRKRLADFFAHLRPAALPCRFCQGAPVVTNNPDNHQPWSVHCARRGQAGHRGHNGNAVPGKTERGQPLKVPGAFLVGIPVFRGEIGYQLCVRLRYRKSGASLVWIMELWRHEEVFDTAIKEACDMVKKATELPLLVGTPE